MGRHVLSTLRGCSIAFLLLWASIAPGAAKPVSNGNKAPAPLNVRDFGAKGDGVTDDAVAIRQAITLGETGGLPVYFPPGYYVVKSTLLITGTDRVPIVLFGDGPSSSLLNEAPADNPTLKVAGRSYFTVRDLAFAGVDGFPNDAIFITKSATTLRSGFGYLRNLVLCPNGIGIHLTDTNTMTIDNVDYQMGTSIGQTGSDSSLFTHAILADGTTAVNGIQIRSLNATGTAPGTVNSDGSVTGGSAIQWNTTDWSEGVDVTDSELEGVVAIDFKHLDGFALRGVYADNARFTFRGSRNGDIRAVRQGMFMFSQECVKVMTISVKGQIFVADETNVAVGAMNSTFDLSGDFIGFPPPGPAHPGYDNRSQRAITLSVAGQGSLQVPDKINGNFIVTTPTMP